MFIKQLETCAEFSAGDNCNLREILHPDKESLAIRYSLAHAKVLPGKMTSPHRLKTAEVYYILEGTGIMFINNESAEVKAGDTIYISPAARQHIKNIGAGTLTFLCIVDPAWQKEDEEVL